jgi:hypothetical protein
MMTLGTAPTTTNAVVRTPRELGREYILKRIEEHALELARVCREEMDSEDSALTFIESKQGSSTSACYLLPKFNLEAHDSKGTVGGKLQHLVADLASMTSGESNISLDLPAAGCG